MNTAQKVICAIGAFLALYLFFCVDAGDYAHVVTVKYNDNLVEYKCKSHEEYEHLKLKSDNNVLFFDGEYFFDEAPTHKASTRVNLVKGEVRNFGGDVSRGEYAGLFLILFLCVAVGCGMAAPPSGYDDYYY
jgi:hypothetical protein